MDENEPLPTRFRVGRARLADGDALVVHSGGGVHRLRDVLDSDVPDGLKELFADWARWSAALDAALATGPLVAPHVVPLAWLPPVEPGKLVCVGTNYRDHIREMGHADRPPFPYSFLKPVGAGIVGHQAAVPLPRIAAMIDWEVELAVVMGSRLRDGAGTSVFDAVAGYTVVNDVSARDWLASAGHVGVDWVMSKGFDGFTPVGPWITPRRFVNDPQRLYLRTWVNGALKQDGSTQDMIFSVQEILEHLSSIMTLEPGDVVATGTPSGVGFGRTPQEFLGDGDVVTVEVEDLGRLETTLVAERTAEPTARSRS